jgi:hypothetical protein
MGACSIIVRATGKNMQDAFRKAKAEADDYYGHQEGYSGAINNCELAGDVTHKKGGFDEDDYFHQWILDNTEKRDVKGYCKTPPVTNTNKIKTVVTNYPQKGTRKWVTKYRGVDKWEGDVVCEADSQTECIKQARAYVEKNPNKMIEVQIHKALEGGKFKVADINYKKASNEKDGLYVFVGWAPE